MWPTEATSPNLSRWLACVFLAFYLGAALCGCGSLWSYYFGDEFSEAGSSTLERGPEQLVRDGVQAMGEKDYDDALEAFQELKEKYPYSRYAILAELKVADAYFYKKEYADAAVGYEEFVRLHPRNEVVPYVLYQLGMCHFLSFSSTDRDLEETELALETFKRLAQAFPESKFARRAEKQMLECEKRLAANEFYIGRFYFHQDKYEAALNRFQVVLDNYPRAVEALGYEEQIREMLSECEECLVNNETGESIWSRMGF